MRDDATDDNVDASEIKHSSEGFEGSFVQISCGPTAVRCRTLPKKKKKLIANFLSCFLIQIKTSFNKI